MINKTIRLKVLFVFGALILINSCFYNSKPRLNYLTSDAIILAFGDSLTAGNGASANESYPEVLASLINRKVINSGISGLQTGAALAKLPGLLEEYHPNLVILCLGGNDMLRNKKAESVEQNLNAMVEMILTKGSQVVLIGVPKPSISLMVPGFYEDIAKRYNVVIENEVLAELERNRKYKSDSIHLNAAGYRKMAERIASFLKEKGAI